MMKAALAAFLAFGLPAIAVASYPFHVVVDKKDAEARIIAVNRGYAPVTVSVDIPATADDRKNIRLEDLPATAKKSVVAARSTSTVLTLRPAAPDQPYVFRYTYRWAFGDERAMHDENARYRLPFPDGMTSRMETSLDARHTGSAHQFDMDMVLPEWTPVLAARSGIVFDVRGYHEGDPAKPGFSPTEETEAGHDLGDLVRVLHDDGSLALYSNLMPSSVLVKPGQRIEAGTRIAFSGNSGDSRRPHLHFGVYTVTPQQKMQSVPWFVYTKERPQLRPFSGDELLADYSMPAAPQEPQGEQRPNRPSKVEDMALVLKSPHAKERPARVQEDSTNPAAEVPEKKEGGKFVWLAILVVVIVYIVYARKESARKAAQPQPEEVK